FPAFAGTSMGSRLRGNDSLIDPSLEIGMPAACRVRHRLRLHEYLVDELQRGDDAHGVGHPGMVVRSLVGVKDGHGGLLCRWRNARCLRTRGHRLNRKRRSISRSMSSVMPPRVAR